MGQLSFGDVDAAFGDSGSDEAGLADLSLRDTTFVIVDLETTGSRAKGDEFGGNYETPPKYPEGPMS